MIRSVLEIIYLSSIIYLIFLYLNLFRKVVNLRRKTKTSIGFKNKELERAIRAHGNFCETVPFGILLTFILYFNNLLYFLLPSSFKDITSVFIIGKKKYINENIFNISSYGDYFVYLVNDLYKNNIDILEVGYLCEMRIYGDSKTGSSISQLIKRGFPYITAAVKCRIGKYENL